MTLVDSDVLIDLQRNHPAAVTWAKMSRQTPFSISGIVAMELLIGSRNKGELEASLGFIRGFDIAFVNESDHAKALELAANHVLSAGLGLADYLIAAQCLNTGATLLTFNLKHFASIPV